MANYGGTPGGPYQMPPPPQRPTAPASVLTAAKLMYAGAALSVVTLIIGLTQKAAIRKNILIHNPRLTGAEIDLAANFTLAFTALFSIGGVALWLWMASASKKGHSWARIVSSVLFGLGTLGLLYTVLARGAGSTAIQQVLSALGWLVGLGVVVFLWRSDSSAYFTTP
jgi:hypothetical protein